VEPDEDVAEDDPDADVDPDEDVAEDDPDMDPDEDVTEDEPDEDPDEDVAEDDPDADVDPDEDVAEDDPDADVDPDEELNEDDPDEDPSDAFVPFRSVAPPSGRVYAPKWLRIDWEHTKTMRVNKNHTLPNRKERKATLFHTMSVTMAITGWQTIFGSRVSVIHSMAELKPPCSSTRRCLK